MERLLSQNFVIGILLAMLIGQLTARPQSDEETAMKKELYKACSEKYPITEEMIKSVKNGIISEDRNYKCFLKCCFEEVGMIDDQGIIDGDAIIEISNHKSVTESIVKSCLPDEAGRPDGCETTYNFFMCSMKVNQIETLWDIYNCLLKDNNLTVCLWYEHSCDN